MDSYLTTYMQINSKWIKNSNFKKYFKIKSKQT